MSTARMSALVERVQTWNPAREPELEFDYIDLSAVDNSSKVITGATRVSGVEAPSRARQLVLAGDVLVSTVRPNLNAVAVVPPTLSGATASTGFTVLRPSPRIDASYLFHWVRSPQFISDMVRKSTGASYPAVSDRIVKDSLIPTPDLAEQRRIAAILDRADAIRAKRRQLVARLDSLASSIFHRLFTDTPVKTVQLGDVASFFGGSSLPTGERFSGQSGGTLLMKVSDMNADGNEEAVQATALWTSSQTPRSSTVGPGAVVLPKRGASIATNKKRLVVRPTALDPNLMGVHPRPDFLTSDYLYAWFRSFDLSTVTSGSAVPQLNKQDLAPIVLTLPPLQFQHQFSERIERVRVARTSAQRALTEDDALFASLQARAFRGEL